MTICACLLLRSLWGIKRTCLLALHMSANDPKRTSTPSGMRARVATMCCPGLGGGNEEAGIHRFYSLQRGPRVAASRARTASSEAGDRVLERPLPRRYWAGIAGVSQRSGRSRLFRRPERDHRIPLGSRRVRPAACVCCRICAAARECTRGDRRQCLGSRSEARNRDDPDRVCGG